MFSLVGPVRWTAGTFVQYEIRCTGRDKQTWVVFKRFSDFQKWKSVLSDTRCLAELTKSLKIPSKKLLNKNSDKVIEERRYARHQFV